jgi:hypothetical protein
VISCQAIRKPDLQKRFGGPGFESFDGNLQEHERKRRFLLKNFKIPTGFLNFRVEISNC